MLPDFSCLIQSTEPCSLNWTRFFCPSHKLNKSNSFLSNTPSLKIDPFRDLLSARICYMSFAKCLDCQVIIRREDRHAVFSWVHMVKNQVKERFITEHTALPSTTLYSRMISWRIADRSREASSFVIVIGPSPMAAAYWYSGLHWNAVKYGRLRMSPDHP